MNFSAFDGTPEESCLRGQLVRDVHGVKMPGCLDSDGSTCVLVEQELGQLHFSHGNSVWINSRPFQSSVQTWGEGGAGEALQAKEAIAFSIASTPQLLAFVVSFRQILGFENLGHRFAKLGF